MSRVEAHRTLTAFTKTTSPVANVSAGFYTLVPGANLVLLTYEDNTATEFILVKIVTTGLSDPPIGGDDANPASAAVGDYHRKVFVSDGTVELTEGGRYEIEALSIWVPTGGAVAGINVVGMVARTGSG